VSRLRRRLLGSLGPTVPARDLPFVDAAVVIAALFLGYGARAAASSNYPLEWAGVAPYVRLALPVTLCALLLSAAALGLYGDRAADAGARQHVAAAVYTAAAAAAIGLYWGGAASPSVPVLLTATVFLAACLHVGRRLYWHVAQAESSPAGPSSSP